MVTLNCNHADAGPVIITTPEPDGLITFLRRYRDEADVLASDVLTCDDYAFTIPARWREVVHGLYGLPRPTFLVTAHPGFLDEVYFTGPEDVRARVLRWRAGQLTPLDEYEAHRVWESYDVGIQHVSEILRSRGLYDGRCPHEFPGYATRCRLCGEELVS